MWQLSLHRRQFACTYSHQTFSWHYNENKKRKMHWKSFPCPKNYRCTQRLVHVVAYIVSYLCRLNDFLSVTAFLSFWKHRVAWRKLPNQSGAIFISNACLTIVVASSTGGKSCITNQHCDYTVHWVSIGCLLYCWVVFELKKTQTPSQVATIWMEPQDLRSWGG